MEICIQVQDEDAGSGRREDESWRERGAEGVEREAIEE
jgi:hypothetical protein